VPPPGLWQVSKFVSKTANTFAPKASGKTVRLSALRIGAWRSGRTQQHYTSLHRLSHPHCLQSKNPAFPGSALYTIFEVQAWLSVAVGGLLAFNLIWPTDGPSIPRLLGMWSVWMMAVPSLRARDCPKREKDALNVLFLAIPVVNVALPFFWKSFSAAFTADVALLAAIYISNGALDGFPDLPEEEGSLPMQPPPPPPPPQS
jgi:hypothetical protein